MLTDVLPKFNYTNNQLLRNTSFLMDFQFEDVKI